MGNSVDLILTGKGLGLLWSHHTVHYFDW